MAGGHDAVGSSTLLPQTGGGYRFHLNTSVPVTTRVSLQQINTLTAWPALALDHVRAGCVLLRF